MTKVMTLWYGREQALFNNVLENHSRLEVTKIAGGSSSPPGFKV